jgi:hypothetical protein
MILIQGTDGNTLVLDNDTNPLSAGAYIKFSPAEFHMEPGGKQKLDLNVAIPAGTKGGRYAVLLAVTNPRSEGGVNTITRLGVPIRLTVADSELVKKGIARLIPPQGIEPGKPIPITVNFINEGNIHYKVRANITVFDSAGTVKGKLQSESVMVLPGYSRDLTAEWVPQYELARGLYKISSTVSTEDGAILNETSGTFEIKDSYVPRTVPAAITLKPSLAAVLNTDDGRISISFPQGAVTSQSKVSLQGCPPEQLPDALTDYKIAAGFKVDGLNGLLVKAATVTVKYSSSDLDKTGGDASKLSLVRWDEADGRWTVLNTQVNQGERLLTASTNQLGVLAVASGPPAAAFNWLLTGIIGGIAVIIGAGISIALSARKRL